MAKTERQAFEFDKRINLANLLAFIMIVIGALAAHFHLEAEVAQNSQAIDYNTERIDHGDDERKIDRTEILYLLRDINDSLKLKADKPGR